MTHQNWAKAALVLTLALTAAVPAFAQATMQRVRGSVVSFSGETLVVATREGPTITLATPAGLQPTALRKIALSDIKPNDFVATVAVPGNDGTLQSVYVTVFPEAMRGRGEGHSDWDLAPGSSMTNATVTSAVTGRNGRVLSMIYKNTPIEITVPESAPVLVPAAATRDDIRPGVKVFITAERAADGSLSTQRMVVGKDGVNPPQ